MKQDIPIAELAARHDVSLRTLRHYERLELLAPRRTETRLRFYSEADSDRVALILDYKSVGLSLEEIRRKLLVDASRLWLTPDEVNNLLFTHRARMVEAKAAMRRIRSIERATTTKSLVAAAREASA